MKRHLVLKYSNNRIKVRESRNDDEEEQKLRKLIAKNELIAGRSVVSRQHGGDNGLPDNSRSQNRS